MSNTILNSKAFAVKEQIGTSFTLKSVKLTSNPEAEIRQKGPSAAFFTRKELKNESEEFIIENVFREVYYKKQLVSGGYPYLNDPTGFLGPGPGDDFNYSHIVLIALKKTKGSLWGVKSISRGFIFEEMLEANLRKIKNYPVIDDFANGVATSIKTLVLSAKGYTKNPQRIYSKLKKYIDDLSNFKGTHTGDINTFGKITGKKIELGIPLKATSEQVKMLEKAVKYAEEKNILLNIRVVK
ncbi:hypothetical protein D3C87_36720 [compost metagenome]